MNISLISKHKYLALAALALLIGLATGGWFAYHSMARKGLPLDSAITNTLDQVSGVKSYSQHVETWTNLGDRSLKIAGEYTVDRQNYIFGAFSTTTLYIGKERNGHTFTHKNIAIGKDVYTKIETSDQMLKGSIQNGPQWNHFTNSTIPASFSGVSVPGPIQDNLLILSDHANYLILVAKHGPSPIESKTLLQYTFSLSGKSSKDGTLSAIMSRVGPSGTVDVWIDPTTFAPVYLRFANPTYISTTSINNINAVPTLSSPIAATP